MRELKFRAWDKELKKWIYDFAIGPKEYGSNLTQVWWHEGFDFAYYPENDLKEMEIMQYTGLKDKNGKEIYEGDIIKRNKTTGKIVWDSNSGGFRWHTNYTPVNFMPLSIDFEFEHEIIGNIYENPELLKEKDETKT